MTILSEVAGAPIKNAEMGILFYAVRQGFTARDALILF